jgi:hypothetical protein
MNLPGKCGLVLLLCLVCMESLPAQDSRKVRQAKHKAEKKKEEQFTQATRARNKRIERHFEMQTKNVQQRMKEFETQTRKHYARQNFLGRMNGLFSKSRKRYGR